MHEKRYALSNTARRDITDHHSHAVQMLVWVFGLPLLQESRLRIFVGEYETRRHAYEVWMSGDILISVSESVSARQIATYRTQWVQRRQRGHKLVIHDL